MAGETRDWTGEGDDGRFEEKRSQHWRRIRVGTEKDCLLRVRMKVDIRKINSQ
jgi:hypothetical protein